MKPKALALLVALSLYGASSAAPRPIASMTTADLQRWVRRFCTPSDHYYYKRSPHLTRGKLRDAVVSLGSVTPLLDLHGHPVYRTDPGKTFALAPGEYDVERHATFQLAGESDTLLYVWSAGGSKGHWIEGGATTADRFSGFIRASAVSRVVSGFLHRDPNTSNRISRGELGSIAQRLGARRARIEPHRVSGTYGPSHVGQLSDYGWAHDALPNFSYALIDLPIHGHIGGVSVMLLPKGQVVRATRLAFSWLANGNLDARFHTFVLCFVDLPARAGRPRGEAIGVWVCLENLPGVALGDLRVVQPW